ncbi:MAG: bifunctional ornithine acetyltransferase/N-acetylglutamate synthase [Oscillospiraceae bacterium]|nr:bifunctional ornithine acetyltransferase/N-acetylglutamate synthase [Oscillospiraceae bacterium]
MLEQFEYTGGGICAAQGFYANAIYCGLSENHDEPDLALIYSDEPCRVALYTSANKFKGAPLSISTLSVTQGDVRGILINSKIANCYDYEQDIHTAGLCVKSASHVLGGNFLNASAGITNIPLDSENIICNMTDLATNLSLNGSELASRVLRSNPAVNNQYAVKFNLKGKECTIGGITSSGAGLDTGYAGNIIIITTDANVSNSVLSQALKYASRLTFDMKAGRPTVNDMAVALSSRKAGNRPIIINSENYEIFANSMYWVIQNLTRQMMASSRGASKLIECAVSGAYDEHSAKSVAKLTVNSREVSAALFDPNAGRYDLIFAIGGLGDDFDRNELSVTVSSDLGRYSLMTNGEFIDYNRDLATVAVSGAEIKILLTIGEGNSTAVAWGSDAV